MMDKLDGLQPQRPEFADTALAVASLSDLKAPGRDEVQAEMVKDMGIAATVRLHENQIQYYNDHTDLEGVAAWNEVQSRTSRKKRRPWTRWMICARLENKATF